MLNLLLKLPLFKLFYYFGFPKIMPISYTFSVSYTCNSKCSTCFVHKKSAVELSLAEYQQIFRKIGKSPYWVTFSGGEPFLRKDFVEIVKSCYDFCKPKIINIPTNGSLTTKILENVKEILQHCKRSQIIINISIDGIGEEHDTIRNFPNSYVRAIHTFSLLKKISPKSGSLRGGGLSVGIHTVISKFNVENFSRIANTLMEFKPDQYITEIAEQRNELGTIGKDITPDLLHYKAAVDFLLHRIKHTEYKKRMNRIAQTFRIEYYNLAQSIIKFKRQIIPCYAGVNSVQISPEGSVWSCCIKAKEIGSLRKNNYDLYRIWKNNKFAKERANIKAGKCHCPLANAGYTNMLMDIEVLFRVFRTSFISRKLKRYKNEKKTLHSSYINNITNYFIGILRFFQKQRNRKTS